MAAEVLAVVPVRLDSSRFEGKALFSVHGKPLVIHLLDGLKKSRRVDHILVATDSIEIRRAVTAAGYDVVLTKGKHQTGTDRVAEAAADRRTGIVINVQGDNYALDGRTLDRVIDAMKDDTSIAYATLARRIRDLSELADTDTVKVVISADGHALWFSRLPVPFQKRLPADGAAARINYYAHIGVYFFRARALREYAQWPRTAAEIAESLEQLRILEHGGRIRVFLTKAHPISIDSPDDLRKLEALDTQG